MAIQPKNDTEIKVDTINEKTAASGVTVDGVLIKDNDVEADEVRTDTIVEKTASNGVLIEQNLFRDAGHNFVLSSGSGGAYVVTITGAGSTPGMIAFRANHTNSSASATVNVNGAGAVNLVDRSGDAMIAHTIPANSIVVAWWDGTNYRTPYERSTPWVDWTPTYSASGSMTFTSVTKGFAYYKVNGKSCSFHIFAFGTTGGTASNALYASAPFTAFATSDSYKFPANVRDASSGFQVPGLGYTASSGTLLAFSKEDLSNFTLGATRVINGSGTYRIQ